MILVFLFGVVIGVFVPDKFAAPAKLVMLGWLASARKTWSGVTDKVDAAETKLKEEHDPAHNHGTSDVADNPAFTIPENDVNVDAEVADKAVDGTQNDGTVIGRYLHSR